MESCDVLKQRMYVLAAVVVMMSASVSQGMMFRGLGDFADGGFFSTASAVSADGSTVVGWSRGTGGDKAFRWTFGGGMVELGGIGQGQGRSFATAVSADGSVIVGGARRNGENGTSDEAFRWTAEEGMVSISQEWQSADTYATAVSANGLIVAGRENWNFAFCYINGAISRAGGIFSDSVETRITGISADGLTMTGYSLSETGYTACMWKNGQATLLGANYGNYATAISGNGSVIVGGMDSEFSTEAFRWTAVGGMVGLGKPAGAETGMESSANAVSEDGSIVAGKYGGRAFIWDEANGMQDLKEMLEKNLGMNLTGWILTSATGISSNGRTIVGNGINPEGFEEAWIVTMPEPATIGLLALGMAFIAGKKKQ